MDPSPERLLDAALPRWDVAERHGRTVQAAPESVWQALREVSTRDLPITRGLMWVRTAGRGSKGGPDRSVLDALPPGELARREPQELLLGLVAPTTLRIDVRSVAALRPVDLDDFGRALPDGWVRIGMDFRLTPVGIGPGIGPGIDTATRLETETRVSATGPGAKRRFAAYWLVVRLGSGVVRRELLCAVAWRAEAGGG